MLRRLRRTQENPEHEHRNELIHRELINLRRKLINSLWVFLVVQCEVREAFLDYAWALMQMHRWQEALAALEALLD